MMELLGGPWVTAAVEFVKKNKWLAGLAMLLALVYFAGNTIVSCVAYFQPKVTVINNTITQSQTRDNTNTKRHEVVHPDGTRELFEEIQVKIEAMSMTQNQQLNVKEPVALPGQSEFALLPGFGYEPVDKRWSLMLGVELGDLRFGLMHELVTMHPDQARFPDGFKPMIWANYRWALGR